MHIFINVLLLHTETLNHIFLTTCLEEVVVKERPTQPLTNTDGDVKDWIMVKLEELSTLINGRL